MTGFAQVHDIFFLDDGNLPPAQILRAIAERWTGAQVVSRRLIIPSVAEITPGGYVPELRTEAYTAAFVSHDTLLAFMAREAGEFGAIGICADADTAGPDTTVYVAADAEAAAAVRAGGGYAYHGDGKTVADAAAMLAQLSQFKATKTVRQQAWLDAVHESDTPVARVAAPVVPAPGIQLGAGPVLLAQGMDVLIGGKGSPQQLATDVAALIGAHEIVHGWQGDTQWTGAEAQAGALACAFYPEDGADWPGLPDMPALLRLSQSLSAAPEDPGPGPTYAADAALKQFAAAFGLCLAIDVPFDSMTGALSGYVAGPDGKPERLRIPVG
jgi:hypothetical protein